MADGNLVRQSGNAKGAVVYGPTVCDVPLLPFEKELIKTIGITEEEYRKFAAEVRRKGLVRPAEYEHLPDVQATGAEPYLISLGVSLLIGGVSYLLMPKPKMPEASKQSQLNLGSVNAGNRFTQSRGFDTLNELADYGAPVPIIFGLYSEAERVGGMLVTPKLVWSRMFSHGTQQSAKLMFVVGEQGFADDIAPDGIAAPDLEGIFLGNNALDAIHKDFFAFYWKKNTTTSGLKRIRAGNLVHGTQGGPEFGDPTEFTATDNDVFLCPSHTSEQTPDFCHAYSPANSVDFGNYGAIPNGTGYRVNYETVSVPDGTDNKQVRVLVLRRMKIVGDKDLNTSKTDDEALEKKIRRQRQEGEGRQYSPRMGLVKLIKKGNVTKITVDDNYPESTLRATEEVAKGDRVEFHIDPSSIDPRKYLQGANKGGESVDDINATVAAEQIAADDAMQIGERFAIGNTLWKVIKRKIERFDPDVDKDQIITLLCVDTSESRQKEIGLVSRSRVITPKTDFIGDGFLTGGVGAGFFPLTRASTGLIRNNRPAVVTEIGLRSKVFQRLNGICAFNSVPSHEELRDFDDKEITVRSGTFTGTILRSSVFQVFVRKAGLDENGDAFEFERVDLYFVVTGSTPVDQYNFIRFTHPQDLGPVELEFKFVHIPGSELRALGDELTVYRLSASVSDEKKDLLTVPVNVPGLGDFGVTFAGSRTAKSQIRLNKEFIRKPEKITIDATKSKPVNVIRDVVLPQDQQVDIGLLKGIEREANISNSPDINSGKLGAFFHEIFGSCDSDPINEGGLKTTQTREIFSTDKRRWTIIEWTVEKKRLPSDHYAHVNNGVTFTWAWRSTRVVGSSDDYNISDQPLEFKRGLGSTGANTSASAYSNSNPFVPNNPNGTMTFSGQRYRITDVERRDFPIGRSQGYYYEVFGSAANLGIGELKTVTRNYPQGTKKIKVVMTATVKELSGSFSGETRGWNHPHTLIVDQGVDTTDNWNEGDTYDDVVTVSSDNPFRVSYGTVGFRYKIGDVKRTAAQTIVTGETEFESQSQYADISLYRGLVQKSNESEPEHSIVYVNEITPNEDEDGESRAPGYNNLTMAGLSLKASRNFTSLDQMRCWLGSGLHVKRLHPDLSVYNLGSLVSNGRAAGPSNLFTDLVFYLLTNEMGGAGSLLKMDETNPALLEKDGAKKQDGTPDEEFSVFKVASRFLQKQKLFFNGVIGDRTNLRQYITDTAPYFLCNFVIMDGKFSLKPAIPVMEKSGAINLGPVPIEQLFTAGNILEDSYKLEYLRTEERRPFKAVMRYRQETKNKLPEERVVEVKLPGQEGLLSQEQFDLTQFCTSEDHAVMVAKYFLGIRKLVSHTISFSTTVHGLNLRAGSYIKVITEATPYSAANTGTVNSSGIVTSISELADGTYNVSYFKTGSEDVEEGLMGVSDGVVADSTFHDTVFSVKNTTVSQNVYVVEQLTFSEEGTVDIVASEHPCDDDGVSELAKLIAGDSVITVRS